jgi:hypothetical protein
MMVLESIEQSGDYYAEIMEAQNRLLYGKAIWRKQHKGFKIL